MASYKSALAVTAAAAANGDGDSKEMASMVSEEMGEPRLLFPAKSESVRRCGEPDDVELGLELTLGLEPVSRANHVVPVKK